MNTPADLQHALRQLELATYDLAQAATYDRLAYSLRSDAVHTLLLATDGRKDRDHVVSQLSLALTRDRAAHKLRRDAAERLRTVLSHLDP